MVVKPQKNPVLSTTLFFLLHDPFFFCCNRTWPSCQCLVMHHGDLQMLESFTWRKPMGIEEVHWDSAIAPAANDWSEQIEGGKSNTAGLCISNISISHIWEFDQMLTFDRVLLIGTHIFQVILSSCSSDKHTSIYPGFNPEFINREKWIIDRSAMFLNTYY